MDFYVKYTNFNNGIKYGFIALCGANSVDYSKPICKLYLAYGTQFGTSIIEYSLLYYKEAINYKNNNNSWEIKDILEVPLF